MQAVILAAGMSRRLRPLTDTSPKCLLDVGGKNLLHRTVENVIENGIKDFIFVTGYREEMIKDYMKENFPNLNIKYLTNADYEKNNNSYSLWMTKNYVKKGILLLDSDILFEAGIIKELLDYPEDNALAVNFNVKLDEEQIKVILDEENKVLEIGKETDISKSEGESIGIEKFSSYFMKGLFDILERKIVNEKNVNEFYEASFQEIIDNKDIRNSIYAVNVSDYKCMEIDTVEDLENARNSVNG